VGVEAVRRKHTLDVHLILRRGCVELSYNILADDLLFNGEAFLGAGLSRCCGLAREGQRNFVDPESRGMPSGANKGSFVQDQNAPIAVASASQVIVAAEITQEKDDKEQLLPMIV